MRLERTICPQELNIFLIYWILQHSPDVRYKEEVSEKAKDAPSASAEL